MRRRINAVIQRVFVGNWTPEWLLKKLSNLDWRWGIHHERKMIDKMTVRYKYLKYRYTNPLQPAKWALRHAKFNNGSDKWEQRPGHYDSYTQQIDNFLLTLKVTDESQCPMEGDGLGHYAEGANSDYDYDWQGNYPRPTEELPLNLPYTSFASGAYSQDRHAHPYFIPDGVEDHYNYLRTMGQSKSVAWDLTKEWVEDIIRSWFGGPLIYASVEVTVAYVAADDDEIEVGSASIGTSYVDDDDIFTCVMENGLVEEALAEARKHLDELKEVV